MGTAFADFAGNGRPGLIVTNHETEMHSLFLNLGGGLFSDVTRAQRRRTGHASVRRLRRRVLDYDNDTRLDIAIANGHVMANAARLRAGAKYAQRNLLLRNTGDRFVDVKERGGSGICARDGEPRARRRRHRQRRRRRSADHQQRRRREPAAERRWQRATRMLVHAIGDKSNRERHRRKAHADGGTAAVSCARCSPARAISGRTTCARTSAWARPTAPTAWRSGGRAARRRPSRTSGGQSGRHGARGQGRRRPGAVRALTRQPMAARSARSTGTRHRPPCWHCSCRPQRGRAAARAVLRRAAAVLPIARGRLRRRGSAARRHTSRRWPARSPAGTRSMSRRRARSCVRSCRTPIRRPRCRHTPCWRRCISIAKPVRRRRCASSSEDLRIDPRRARRFTASRACVLQALGPAARRGGCVPRRLAGRSGRSAERLSPARVTRSVQHHRHPRSSAHSRRSSRLERALVRGERPAADAPFVDLRPIDDDAAGAMAFAPAAYAPRSRCC